MTDAYYIQKTYIESMKTVFSNLVHVQKKKRALVT
jgi:hypothetical protein